MSAASKSILRQTSLLYRVYHPNIVRQTLAPLSISSRHLAEASSTNASTHEPPKQSEFEGKSYDSVPVHLGRIAKIVMVLGGRYGRLRDVPDSIPNRVYQRTKDRFRARCVIFSLFGTALLSFVAAIRGKNASKEGKRYTDSVYDMHRGQSRLHEQLEAKRRDLERTERYSTIDDEIK